eukprot:scaffold15130_cov127-Skeletonema_dohrnii-CCMP3373.AAC.5
MVYQTTACISKLLNTLKADSRVARLRCRADDVTADREAKDVIARETPPSELGGILPPNQHRACCVHLQSFTSGGITKKRTEQP